MAQLVETRLINILHFQTMIASKAARMVLAAPGKILSDFGLRTAHGAEAGLFSARASYIAGFASAANVLAGERYGIPIVGTMAHSFVQVHGDEMTAFENFARARPDGVILLIDTYDTEAGARKVVELAPKLKADGIAIRGVRIDSGDLAAMARKVRAILDAGGLKDVIILVSGGINEDVLQTMMATRRRSMAMASASISMHRSMPRRSTAPTSCRNTPARRGANCRKARSHGPAASRCGAAYGTDGACAGYFVSGGRHQPGEALIAPVMRAGKRIAPAPTLAQIRERAARELARLPEPLRQLKAGREYRVTISDKLSALAAQMDKKARG